MSYEKKMLDNLATLADLVTRLGDLEQRAKRLVASVSENSRALTSMKQELELYAPKEPADGSSSKGFSKGSKDVVDGLAQTESNWLDTVTEESTREPDLSLNDVAVADLVRERVGFLENVSLRISAAQEEAPGALKTEHPQQQQQKHGNEDEGSGTPAKSSPGGSS